MITKFIEAQSEAGNWGKFMLGVFDTDEWSRTSEVLAELGSTRGLLTQIGMGMQSVLVFDLQTNEGAVMRPGGHASNDLKKHAVWVCPLFEPFLEWLWEDWKMYEHTTRLPAVEDWITDKLPSIIYLKGVPLQTAGYRREGPDPAQHRD